MANPLAATPWERGQKKKPMPGERTYENVLNEARESKYKNAQEVIHSQRIAATFDYQNAQKQQRFLNAPMPDDIHDFREARTSPTGILAHHDGALSPPRLSRVSAPPQLHPPAHLILSPPSPSEPVVYPWETETPKAMKPMPKAVIGPVPRSEYVDPSPSLWNMGGWPGFTGPPSGQANSEGMYDMLQHIKDEQQAPHLQGRPYTPNLYVPLPPPKEPWVRPATSDMAGRPRIRTVLRPRPGFPGALAVAPAGYQAMLAECKAGCQDSLPPVMAPGRLRAPSQPGNEHPTSRRASVPTPVLTELQLPLPEPDVDEEMERSSCPAAFTRLRPAPDLTPCSATPEIVRSITPDLTRPDAPEPQEELLRSPSVSDDKTLTTTTLPPILSPKQKPTFKTTTTNIIAAQVWVGNRGKVVHGRVVP